MIIVITNRNLPVIPQHQKINIKVTSLGVNLGSIFDNKDRNHVGSFEPERSTGKPQTSLLTFYPRGNEEELFDNINDTELSKPWVFFVHGFHQDPDECVAKAKAVQDNYGCNVVMFAWPSRPLDHTVTWGEVAENSLANVLKGKNWKRVAGEAFLSKFAGELKDTWHNYPPAIANAEKSHIDLIAAMTTVKDKLRVTQPPMLLVHSMGNYLLQNTFNYPHIIPMSFNNIMLHQADVTVPDHDWVKMLKPSLVNGKRLYITTNFDDNVLSSSQARRLALKIKGEIPLRESTRRMGRYIQDRLDDVHYIDFTDAEGIDDDHEIFRRAEDETNPYVFSLLRKIVRAEDDGLPSSNNSSENGFSKMPVATHLYKLKEIIHLADKEDETRIEDLVPVQSLDLFNDNYESNLDEELDDDE